MSNAIPMRTDFNAHDLKRFARRSNDAKQVRRLMALIAILEGKERGEAAALVNVDIQTLRDWVIRYNAEGIEGLVDKKRTGRKKELNKAQRQKLAAIVLMKPDLEIDGIVRWRLCDLQGVVKEHFWKDLSENTISRYLKEAGLSWITARPLHPLQDSGDIDTFKKTSKTS
jgi:transposase